MEIDVQQYFQQRSSKMTSSLVNKFMSFLCLGKSLTEIKALHGNAGPLSPTWKLLDGTFANKTPAVTPSSRPFLHVS